MSTYSIHLILEPLELVYSTDLPPFVVTSHQTHTLGITVIEVQDGGTDPVPISVPTLDSLPSPDRRRKSYKSK